jgi:hypothetical protein
MDRNRCDAGPIAWGSHTRPVFLDPINNALLPVKFVPSGPRFRTNFVKDSAKCENASGNRRLASGYDANADGRDLPRPADWEVRDETCSTTHGGRVILLARHVDFFKPRAASEL